MAFQGSRRALLGAAVASLALLAGCGGGSVVSQFAPTRVIAIGDAMVDVGQTGRRYTINNGGNGVWAQQLAASYGLTLTPASAGGTGFGTGNARITATPDAAGTTGTRTVAQQVGDFVAGGGRFGADDLVVVQAGTSDIIAEVTRANAGLQTQAQAQSNIDRPRMTWRPRSARSSPLARAGWSCRAPSTWAARRGPRAWASRPCSRATAADSTNAC